MSRYCPEFRESVVKKMMPPNAQSRPFFGRTLRVALSQKSTMILRMLQI